MRKKIQDWAIIGVVLVGLWLAFTLVIGGIERLRNPEKVEFIDGELTLHIVSIKWFRPIEEYDLYARPNPDDDNQLEWARKSKDGKYIFVNPSWADHE